MLKFYIFLTSFFAVSSLWAIVDNNNNGLSDVWERKFSILSANPLADPDGDGYNNLAESLAGTDPSDNQSFLRITNRQDWASGNFISWQSQNGLKYQMQKSPDMMEGNWEDLGTVSLGNGGEMTVASDINGDDRMFYRLNVLDTVDDRSLLVSEALENFTFDTDGDGVSDVNEISVGLNPFEAKRRTELPKIDMGVGVSLTWPSEFGKYYQLQSRLIGAQFRRLDVSDVQFGTGSDITVSIIDSSALSKIYSVVSFDRDSDGDGVTDWEENQLGLDPNLPKTDPLGPGDLAVVNAQFTAADIVSIKASQAVANITGLEDGGVEITREGGVNELTVRYTVSGTAIAGQDYVALSGSVSIPFGARSVVIPIIPLASSPMNITESVIITLLDLESYNLGSDNAQQVNVLKELAINVKDYGAIGDGITDDTLAIQSAIDFLESSSRRNTLHFPAGTYRVNSTTFTATHTTNTSNHYILELGGSDLSGRDIIITGDENAEIYSTVSPLRARIMLVFGTFRSIQFRGVNWRKTERLLSRRVGLEPNGSDAVGLIDIDDRDIESVDFIKCTFDNCHRAVTVDFVPYTSRKKIKRIGFYQCLFDNPYGSNTIDGSAALGGGQQVYISPWADFAEYEGNVFNGSSDLMNESNNPGGIRKDGTHFGSPGRVRFVDNVVYGMGVEGFYQTGDHHRLGAIAQNFVMPPADSSTIVDLFVNFDPFFISKDELVSVYFGRGIHSVFKVVSIDSTMGIITVVNEGYSTNEPAGQLITSGRQVYYQVPEVTQALVEDNVFIDSANAIVVSSFSEIRRNYLYNCGVLVNMPFFTPAYPAGEQSRVIDNSIRHQAGDDHYNNGIYTWVADTLIKDNSIVVDRSRRFIGIRVAGANSQVINNTVMAEEPVINGYVSPFRSVGLAIHHLGTGTVYTDNTTQGFDVGVGPEVNHAVIPHSVLRHTTTNDQLGVDPRGVTNN